MWKLLIPAVLMLALLGVSLAGDAREERADLVLVNRGDVATLDLAQLSWLQDFRVARLLFEGLTRQDVFDPDYAVRPATAESWEISPDKRTYTFRLRADAEWSDGSPVTSHDFRFAWRRILLPDYAADYSKLMALLEGGREFLSWRLAKLKEFADTPAPSDADRARAAEELWAQSLAKFDELVALRAPDPRTLVVTLERPTPYFLGLTAFPSFAPLPEALLSRHERLDPRTARLTVDSGWMRPEKLVTNGPFVLSRWRFKRDMRFEPNPHYWDRASLTLRSIEIPSITDPNTQVLAFATGAVDWVSDVSVPYKGDMLADKARFYAQHAGEVERLRREGWDPVEIDRRLPPDPRATVHTFPTFGTMFLNLNCLPTLRDGRANPFADARVRRAFALALDKESITRDVRRGGEPVLGVLVPPGAIPGYRSPKGLGQDVPRAQRELADAGYPQGRGFPTVEILLNAEGGHDLYAQAVAKDWAKNLGVEVRLIIKERIVFRQDLKNANYMVSSANWFGDYADPTTFLDLSRTADGNNDRKYSSPRYDALLDAAAIEPDERRRLDLLHDAERLLVEEDLPIIPMFQAVQIYQFDPHKLLGISPHPAQVQHLHLVDIVGDGRGTDTPRTMPRGWTPGELKPR
jgi:oligopeptide transport system substrate-binding protein